MSPSESATWPALPPPMTLAALGSGLGPDSIREPGRWNADDVFTSEKDF